MLEPCYEQEHYAAPKLADYECSHGRLSGDRTPPCGCWMSEPGYIKPEDRAPRITRTVSDYLPVAPKPVHHQADHDARPRRRRQSVNPGAKSRPAKCRACGEEFTQAPGAGRPAVYCEAHGRRGSRA